MENSSKIEPPTSEAMEIGWIVAVVEDLSAFCRESGFTDLAHEFDAVRVRCEAVLRREAGHPDN